MAYKTLDKLISEVQEQIKKLEYGQLNIQDLDDLVDNSKELNERLIVLRYKAYDHKIKSKENIQGEIPLLFKMESSNDIQPEIYPNQTSLIDAIEEVTEEVVEEIPEKKEEAKEEKKEEVKEEVKVEIEEKKEEVKKAQEEKKVEEKSSKPLYAKKEENPHASLFDDNSLVNKLTKTPIPNLKKHISLNQKFRFISALFGGDADEYNKSISILDDLSSFKEAEQFLNENIRNKYELEGDEEEIHIFLDIIQRRYL